jgi:hypothetical protein
MTDKTVLIKIQKLLSLANSDNEHEARLAAEKANALLIKHNLTMQQAKDVSEDYENTVLDLGKRAPVVTKYINSIVLKHFFVELIRSRRYGKSTISVLGTKTNVEIAVYVHSYLTIQFESLWKAYKARTGVDASAKQSYWMGLFRGLDAQLSAQRAAVQRETGLVVVKDMGLEKFKASQFNQLTKSAKTNVNIKDTNAMAAGREDGAKMRITKAMHSSGSGQTLALGGK